MKRRRTLVTYDISDDRRRNQVFKYLLGYGDHTQFSVFLCELTEVEKLELVGLLTQTIHDQEDQVLLLDLGRATRPLTRCMESLGRPHDPRSRSHIV